ncbi:leucine-rich repeat-containing protein 31 [Anguilla rostrata]|uniref:leucine-rich repeat-containing protein 31 n=1 Tax=Anguilla rostrata TaxID=7938 RepID=UPI0030CE495B
MHRSGVEDHRMEHTDSHKGRECPQKRSPFDMIMNQIRRTKSITDRRPRASVGRFFRPTENSDKKDGGIPDSGEPEAQRGEEKMGRGVPVDSELSSMVGWGRVKLFVQKLGKKLESHSLNLGHCDLTATDVLELATLLPFLSQLEEMDLSWNDLCGGSLKALAIHLRHVSRLRMLRLSSCRLTADDLTALGEALGYLPLLEVVDLSWNAGVGGNLQRLISGLQPGNTVKELHLVECQLTAADAQALGGALSMLPSLELLDLSANRHLEGGLCELAPQLKGSLGLKVLRMRMCGLRQDSLQTLGEAIQFLPALEQLDLSCNQGASGGFAQMSAYLTQLMHLRSLDLHQCNLTEEDVQALVQVVPSLGDLTMLDLSSNKTIGRLAQMLFPTLPLSKLKTLSLNSCCLTEESYHSLASAVQSLGQLESLGLSWNKCVGGNLRQVLQVLQPGSHLQELRLASCGLNTEDLLHLASASKRGALVHLRKLDLMYNDGVGEQGWTHLFKEAEGLRAMCELDVSLHPSGHSSVRPHASPWLPTLLSALPRLPSLISLSLQGWALTSRESDGLEAFSRDGKRSVHFDYDPHPAAARV